MPVAVCIILGIIATIVLTILMCALVMPKKKYNNLPKFFKFLHDFFNFKKLYIEAVARFFFMLNTISCIAFGFFMLFGYESYGFGYYFGGGVSTFWFGLCLIIFGPIINRLVYEVFMMGILLVKNVMDINNTLNKKGSSVGFANADEVAERISNVSENVTSTVSAKINEQQSASSKEVQQPTVEQPVEQPQDEKVICAQCGTELGKDAKFCPKCGNKM